MRKRIGGIFLIAIGIMLSNTSIAPAQQTPRSVCCAEMGGVWRAARNGDLRCYSLGRGAADTYYKCVENKTFGKGKKK